MANTSLKPQPIAQPARTFHLSSKEHFKVLTLEAIEALPTAGADEIDIVIPCNLSKRSSSGTCPVQTSGLSGTNLGRAFGRDVHIAVVSWSH